MPHKQLRWVATATLVAGAVLGAILIVRAIQVSADVLVTGPLPVWMMAWLGLVAIVSSLVWNVWLRSHAQRGEDLQAIRQLLTTQSRQPWTQGAATSRDAAGSRTQGASSRSSRFDRGRHASSAGTAGTDGATLKRGRKDERGGTCGACGQWLPQASVEGTCPQCGATFTRIVHER